MCCYRALRCLVVKTGLQCCRYWEIHSRGAWEQADGVEEMLSISVYGALRLTAEPFAKKRRLLQVR